MAGNKIPTDYANKTTTVSGDSMFGFDSEAGDNKNITSQALADFAFTDKTTTDLVEGVNEYYTNAKVDANSTVVALGTDKADKTNVLELNNTTPYTPTLQYHPVTKDYADNMGTNINGLTEEPSITNGDELIFYDATANANRKVDYTDLITQVSSSLSSNFVGVGKDVTYSASDNQKYLDTEEYIGLSGANIFVGDFTVQKNGIIRVEYDIGIDGNPISRKLNGFIERDNGTGFSRVTAEFEVDGDVSGNNYQTSPSYDLSCTKGDIFRIEGNSGINNPRVKITNIKVSFDRDIMDDITKN